MSRNYSLLDKLLIEFEHAAKTLLIKAPKSQRQNPADPLENTTLSKTESQISASLMRVDHTGEICAQALYRGQAFVAKSENTRAHLWQAADEEHDHLAWCQKRLNQLNSHTSFLNPFWYSGSFFIGVTAGFISDKLSYSFVVETEKQVMKHLDDHLNRLPENDHQSYAILEQMHKDEAEHAQNAENFGGRRLPLPIRLIMKIQSKVMTTTAYYF